MKNFARCFTTTSILIGLALAGSLSAAPGRTNAQVIAATAGMVSDPEAQKAARSHGLQILNVTWEDTGRYKNSAVGPNISDMTLQVIHGDRVTCLPVIRFPNFEDKSADLQLEKFYILVGNEKGRGLRKICLRDYLENFRSQLHDSESWKGDGRSLLASRDSHALVSAQACFLPIPKEGEARFNPVLFNYQSYKDNPAVLSLVCTREGTSATIIDNTRDAFPVPGGAWGQRLFFNQNGERASFTGQRLSDFQAHNPQPGHSVEVGKSQQGLNMVLLVQIPLKHKPIPMRDDISYECAPCPSAGAKCERGASDVENAVVGHGEVEGPFTEIDHLAIERDPQFPIRVTVQFYKATSNGVANEKDLAEIAAQINQVYADGDYVGSLVTNGETDRPTEHSGPKNQPATWWNDFWRQYHSKIKPH